jgi:hypothetical protein
MENESSMVPVVNERRLCQRCVLPESDLFPLDAAGMCRICRTPSLLKHITAAANEKELERIIARTRQEGRRRPFDCAVAWSGGRDSTFMLHQLVREHGLRCAAIFGTTPFTPEEIIQNVRSISSQLGLKLIEVQSLPNHRAVAAFCLREYLRTGKPILINLACAPCKFINREIFRFADRLGIRTIFYGGNRYEYFPSGPASIDINTRNRYSFLAMLGDNLRRVGKGLATVLDSPSLFRYGFTFFGASIPYINQYSIYLRLRYPSIARYDYYHYADWDEGSVSSVLRDLHWKLPDGCISTWRADCVFEAVKNKAFQSCLGFTYTEALLSNLIRAGKITRELAMIRLRKERISEARLEVALKICGMPPDSFGNFDDSEESCSTGSA